jgi:predicted transcriptional regulator
MKLTTYDEFLNENVNESLTFDQIKDKFTNNPYGIGAQVVTYQEGERGHSNRIVFKHDERYGRDNIESKLKALGVPAKKLSKSTADKAYKYRYELTLYENENFLNEALKDITISDSEAEEIFDEIKRLTKLHKEKGFVSGEVSVDGFAKASGAFGLNPDDKNLKLASISATTFGIFACITTQANIVVCYATLGYDTLKKKLKPGSYSLTFYSGRESHFNQMARQYKKTIYSK